MKKILFAFACLQVPVIAASQLILSTDTLRKDALNVYMEANDYYKKEIPFVNYVRDIKDADVYIISTSERTGSGGYVYSYFLTGQKRHSGMADTLSVITNPDETREEIRIKQVRTLKMGLMRYIVKTPLSKYMNITFSEPLSETIESDKWNSWVFRASVNGWLNGQQTYSSEELYGDLSAARVTDKWKINIRGRYNYGRDIFEISGQDISSENNSRSVNSLVVKSISDHWSYGGSAYIGSSTFSNEELTIRFMPGIEYDLFPYSESTRRQLRILYSIGLEHANYIDTTIFEKISEAHLVHSIDAAYEVLQKWGTIELSLNYRNYLHDWSKNNLSLNGYMSIRIFKGMSVNFSGGAAMIHDQLSLVKGGATPEEILLRRKELATKFNYYTSFGFSFTFGSIYNNVVNPRFGN